MNPAQNICKTNARADPPPRSETAYRVYAEGAEYQWDLPTITVAQVRDLAGWAPRQPVVEVDLETGAETTPDPARPVTLRAATGFARKIRFTEGVG